MAHTGNKAARVGGEEILIISPRDTKGFPRYKMLALIGTESKQCFVSAAALELSDDLALLCALQDGAAFVPYRNHPYFESKWALREFPKQKELISKIEQRCQEQLARDKA